MCLTDIIKILDIYRFAAKSRGKVHVIVLGDSNIRLNHKVAVRHIEVPNIQVNLNLDTFVFNNLMFQKAQSKVFQNVLLAF